MQVTIERKSGKVGTGLTGLFKVHAYTLDLSITFTETELAAIKKANLQEYIILRRPFHPGYGFTREQFERVWEGRLSVGALLRIHRKRGPDTVFYAETEPERNEAEAKLRDGLVHLKSAIESTLTPQSSKDSFEL